MQKAKRSGIDGLFWYFRFNGFFLISNGFLITDDIIKNDFDGVSSLIFPTKVRLFVLILKYNCFIHELQMPEVWLFLFEK
jgi:hypothetical protein